MRFLRNHEQIDKLRKLVICGFIFIFFTRPFYEILKGTEDLHSGNFVQSFLIAITNIFFYYSLYLIIYLFLQLFISKREDIPLSLKQFLLNFYSDIVEVSFTRDQKLLKIPKNFYKVLFFSFFCVFLLVAFQYNLSLVLGVSIQAFFSIFNKFNIKSRPIEFAIKFIRLLASIVSWLLVSSVFLDNFLMALSGLFSLKSIFLFYNEYYIIWGVGFNLLVLCLLIVFYFLAQKLNVFLLYSQRAPILITLLLLGIGIVSWEIGKSDSFYKILISNEQILRKLPPLPKNKKLENWVIHRWNFDVKLKNFKEKTLLNNQEKINAYFRQNKISNYISNVSKKLSINEKVGFVAIPYHSVFKAEKHAENLPSITGGLEIQMFQNEWESFQLILLPSTSEYLRDIKIQFSSKNLSIFEDIEIFQNDFIKLLKPAYLPKHKGEVADALIPLKQTKSQSNYVFRNEYPFHFQTGECNSILINLKTSSKSRSGKHLLKLDVECYDLKNRRWLKQTVSVVVNVLSFSLPERKVFKTAFSVNTYDMNYWQFYNQVTSSTAIYDHMSKQLKNYHLNPSDWYHYFDQQPFSISFWKSQIEKGANSIFLGAIEYMPKDSVQHHQKIRKLLKNKVDSLKKYGLFEYAYVYLWDEIEPNEFNKLKEVIDFVRSIDPQLKISCSAIYSDKFLANQMDIFIPRMDGFDSTYTHNILKNPRKEIWWYWCNEPDRQPYPNFFTDYPAISPRIVFWQAYRYGITGFQYYSTTHWLNNGTIKNHPHWKKMQNNPYEKQLNAGLRWPEVPWVSYTNDKVNGEGVLFYPGKNPGDLWPSLRLINIRDGIEDYEVFSALEEKVAKINDESILENYRQWKKEFTTFIYSWRAYKDEPESLLELKKRAGLLLERMQKSSKK